MRLRELTDRPFSFDDCEIAGICCDSRKVTADSLFVCIEGTARDGHDFAADASAKGAVVMTNRPLGLPREITVEDTRREWAALCRRWFGDPAARLRLIGVTGTNGKTTVTWLIKSALESCGHKVGLIGTVQNMIGERVVPSSHTTPDPYELHGLFAEMVKEGCDFAVMEVSSHALCQDRVEGCAFEVAAFTNLTQDHLDYHGTMDAYCDAKRRLFFQSARAVMNGDDPWQKKMAEGISCPVTTFSLGDGDVTAGDCRPRPDGTDFVLAAGGERAEVCFHVPGEFSVYNALTAAGCLLALGFSVAQTAAALSAAEGVKGRAEIVPCPFAFTVVIDYAHTPDGLLNICRTLSACCRGRLITVFGCGGDRDRTKRPKMGRTAAEHSDLLVITSDNPRSEDPLAIIEEILPGVKETDTPYTVEPDRAEAIRQALLAARPGDTVLLAGKGHETYQIRRDGTVHMDEREIAAAVFAKMLEGTVCGRG